MDIDHLNKHYKSLAMQFFKINNSFRPILIEVNLDSYFIAKTFNYLGRKKEAIEDYTKAIDINPQAAEPYNNRGYNCLIVC